MPRLTFRQRRQRQREAMDEVSARMNRIAEDPGLRETFDTLPRAPVRLIVPPMGKFVNHGGVLRIAEAFRLEHVFFEWEDDRATDFSGGAGVMQWQPYSWASVPDAIAKSKSDGFAIYGLALGERSVAVDRIEWRFPCALVLGQEKFGMPADIAALCDELVAIPLYGIGDSLNVTAACAICVHAAVAAHAREGEFEPARAVSRRLAKPSGS